MLVFNNLHIDTDKLGYLLDHTLWTKELAAVNAAQEYITLSEQHWEVINFVRNF
ncbi:TusE/DsrC/DsvC family sulfur relay protein, partial [Pseudoalteromonas carrageenovora]|uniref:TusE/DsrC/DsvC family sulfur relay protein n=1 Tax=Pseudoalteromonas carrageenovora TaxID=227 RepID=UPI00312051D7